MPGLCLSSCSAFSLHLGFSFLLPDAKKTTHRYQSKRNHCEYRTLQCLELQQQTHTNAKRETGYFIEDRSVQSIGKVPGFAWITCAWDSNGTSSSSHSCREQGERIHIFVWRSQDRQCAVCSRTDASTTYAKGHPKPSVSAMDRVLRPNILSMWWHKTPAGLV